MKKPDYKITGWQKLFCSSNVGTFLSIAFTILPFGLLGSSWDLAATAEVGFRVMFLRHWLSLILVSVNNAIISVVICTLVLVFAALGTYARKLWKDRKRMQYDNETKEQAIIGLREVIRLLEEKNDL